EPFAQARHVEPQSGIGKRGDIDVHERTEHFHRLRGTPAGAIEDRLGRAAGHGFLLTLDELEEPAKGDGRGLMPSWSQTASAPPQAHSSPTGVARPGRLEGTRRGSSLPLSLSRER